MLLTLVPVPATEATEALEGVVSLLSHEVFGTFVRRLVFSAARVEERVTLLMAEIRERLGREGLTDGERSKPRFARASHHSACAHLIDLPTDKVGNAAKKGVPFADRATEPPIEKTDHALRAVVPTTADKCIMYALAEQDHGARRRTNSYWPASQSDLLPPADDDTPFNSNFHSSTGFHKPKELGIMSLASVFCKEGSPNNTIAVGSDNILSLTLPLSQVHDRCDEDNCGLVVPEQNISLDKLNLEALTHLGSRPPTLRELDLLGTFDLHQSPITTGRKVRPNKEAKTAGDNAEEDLIGTFIAWISQRGLVPTGLNAFFSGIVEHYCQRALPSIYQERLHHQEVLLA
ncbi:hypothetical protein D6D12_09556 [Aureobasidium pullulans]|uniref:Uncharacterized protein n=1 Tax=Aureobasidium pullulans TaxID=5580 RepID=A0AB74JG84_AURPU|nr:hypothetical protein D6D12_09556 [Aureobasidium pullulans]